MTLFERTLFLGIVLLRLTFASASAGKNSTSWAGSNNYYLHALLPQEQTSYISSLQADGAKVVRLWVTGIQTTCTKSSNTTILPNYEVVIGQYETATLDAIDSVLGRLHKAGIKAVISPHDANLLPPNGSTTGYNGIDIYGETYGTSDKFYTNTTAQAQYDARLTSILNYVSPHFNKRWADLHEVILAFDLQNEPLIASPYLLSANDPSSWLCNRAKTLRSVLGSSKVKIATGGIGGSEYSGHEYNLLPAALNCADIDIMSIHGYMSTETQWTPYVSALCEQSARSGKLCFIEEWGVGTGTGDDSVAVQAALFNEWGVPWLYWMVILGKSVDQTCLASDGACCHVGLSTDPLYDFEISLTSSRANFSQLFHAASSATALQNWRKLVK